MKTGKTLVELATEIERQATAKQDYVASTQALEMVSRVTEEGETIEGLNTPESLLLLGNAGQYEVNDLAHQQVADHLGIPWAYYNRLRREQPQLLDTNANTLFRAAPIAERRMVRTLDGRARAFLSDRYRRLDNVDLMEYILPELYAVPGMHVASAEITEKRLYVKVTSDRIQGEVTVGDTVQMGVVIANSEVGYGAISVYPFFERLVCVNGMIVTDYGQRKQHVGKQVGGEGEVFALFSDETMIADDRAFFMKVRDITRNTFSDLMLNRVLDKMREAAGLQITEPEVAVEMLTKRSSLTQDERGSVLRHLIEGHDLTLWGLANAVTRTATDAVSYDRATELETIGGSVISLQRSEWRDVIEPVRVPALAMAA